MRFWGVERDWPPLPAAPAGLGGAGALQGPFRCSWVRHRGDWRREAGSGLCAQTLPQGGKDAGHWLLGRTAEVCGVCHSVSRGVGGTPAVAVAPPWDPTLFRCSPRGGAAPYGAFSALLACQETSPRWPTGLFPAHPEQGDLGDLNGLGRCGRLSQPAGDPVPILEPGAERGGGARSGQPGRSTPHPAGEGQ